MNEIDPELQADVEQEQEQSSPTLGKIADVLEYLQKAGWKVTKSSLYRHFQEGKFRPQEDGCFRKKDVDRYATTWLKEIATGKRVDQKISTLQRQKLELELQNLRFENLRKARLNEKETGALVPRSQMELEMAARAGILDAGLKHLVQANAAEWIRIAGGDTNKVGELINHVSRQLDQLLNDYASTREYEVIFDAAEEEAEEQPGEEKEENDGCE